jgi:hypothetical protein
MYPQEVFQLEASWKFHSGRLQRRALGALEASTNLEGWVSVGEHVVAGGQVARHSADSHHYSGLSKKGVGSFHPAITTM